MIEGKYIFRRGLLLIVVALVGWWLAYQFPFVVAFAGRGGR